MNAYSGKRAFDLAVTGAACLLFAPVVAGVAVAILLDDAGPVTFSQSRVGRARQPFTLLKFRSMRNQEVTRVGQWLRSTGIDELPQFVNVCRGEMSVVGPRPLTAQDVTRLGWNGPEHDSRFAAKPGITGLSQLLAGRGARASERLDRLYLRKQSLALDAKLLALSFAVNLLGKRKIRRWMRPAPPRYT
jgi:lipopolysaccharide/colanic/teichoic acid biosynthesis glycosyltransferase